MEKLNLDKKNLRNFGLTMGIAFLIIGLLIASRHRYNPAPAYAISALFLIVGLIIPGLLKPLYIAWMRLAFILSWINTRLLLLIIFYLIFTPIGLVMRICGRDLLDRKIDKCKESYWRKKEERGFRQENYERQF